jgi:hypothetical protein
MGLQTSLERLATLKDNWDMRGSAAPSDAAIRTASGICAVPLGSGGIQLDLYAGGGEVEIEIDAVGAIVGVAWTKR